jgi:hypothetical protein
MSKNDNFVPLDSSRVRSPMPTKKRRPDRLGRDAAQMYFLFRNYLYRLPPVPPMPAAGGAMPRPSLEGGTIPFSRR